MLGSFAFPARIAFEAEEEDVEGDEEDKEEEDEEDKEEEESDNENAADDDREDDFSMAHDDLDIIGEIPSVALQHRPR